MQWIVILIFTFILKQCTTPEDQAYKPPESLVSIVVLPYVEEEFLDKTYLVKKKSPYFAFGIGISENLRELLSQNSELLVVYPEDIFHKLPIEKVLGEAKFQRENFKELEKITWVLTGSFQYDPQKKAFEITSYLYDPQGNSKKLPKVKGISFTTEQISYLDFLKNQLYSSTIKTLLCERVKKEECPPLKPEFIANLDLTESSNFSAFLNYSRGLTYLYESYNLELDKLESLKKRNIALTYFKKAILDSSREQQKYPHAVTNLVNIFQSKPHSLLDLDLELKSYTIASYNFPSNPFQHELTSSEISRLRKVLQKALWFVKLNPEYKIQVMGHWSKNLYDTKTSEQTRSGEILNLIFPEGLETLKDYINYTDIVSLEDKVEFGIIQGESIK